jgi:hypothetical protein
MGNIETGFVGCLLHYLIKIMMWQRNIECVCRKVFERVFFLIGKILLELKSKNSKHFSYYYIYKITRKNRLLLKKN